MDSCPAWVEWQDQEAKDMAKERANRASLVILSCQNHTKFDSKLHDLMPPTWLQGKIVENKNGRCEENHRRKSELAS